MSSGMVCGDCGMPVRWSETAQAWFHDLGEGHRDQETIAREVKEQ